MYLSNQDIEVLLEIEKELWNTNSTKYTKLWKLIESKLVLKEKKNKINSEKIKAKRKINPTYARSKKELARRKVVI